MFEILAELPFEVNRDNGVYAVFPTHGVPISESKVVRGEVVGWDNI